MYSSQLRTLFLSVIAAVFAQSLQADLIDREKGRAKAISKVLVEPVKPSQKVTPSPSPERVEPQKKATGQKRKKQLGADANKSLPITYTGEILFGSKQLGKVSIEQKVNVNQGDLSLRADRADIFFLETQEGVDKVNASGNVYIDKVDFKTQKKIKASGRFAQYDARAGTILIKGEAKLQRGDDLIQGNYIVYDMKTGGIEAGKVAGVVAPDEKEGEREER